MEKTIYSQPMTKIMSLSSHGDVCDVEILSDNLPEPLYGPPSEPIEIF